MSGNPEHPQARIEGAGAHHVRNTGPASGPGLFEIIQRQIIPRLMHTHQVRQRVSSDQDAWRQRRCAELAELSVASDDRAAFNMTGQLLAAGLALDTLLFELIPATAELLGEQWEQDTRDFTEVTIGLWRLHLIIRELTPVHPPAEPGADVEEPLSILLAPAPGEQHTLGLLLVAECFQREGWSVQDLAVSTRDALLNAVSNQTFDAVGLSVGVTDQLPALARLTQQIRETAYNRRLLIMLGGRGVSADETTRSRLGVDLICSVPQEAPSRAAELIGMNMAVGKSQAPSGRRNS